MELEKGKVMEEVQIEQQVSSLKRKISVYVGGVVSLSILCIVTIVIYYELKMRSIAGAVYGVDVDAGRMIFDELFRNHINRSNVDMFYQGMISCGYTENGSRYLLQSGGQLIMLAVTAFVLIAELAATVFIVRGISRNDICTRFIKMQNENQKFKEQMEQLTIYTQKRTNVLYEFIENVAHQIKTPLTALTISLDILKEQKGEGGNCKVLDDALFNAERIKTFIVRLMNISRLESGKIKLKHEEINLSEFLHEAATLSDTGDCEVLIDCSDTEYCIDGDYEWLLDAFSNIIGNSTEYADRVDVGVEVQNGKCVVTVKDNGKGFEQKNIERIFDRFESGNEAKAFHMGIGLNLAKLVIEAHYGKISAYNDSEKGGAVFRIMLPQYQLKKGKI